MSRAALAAAAVAATVALVAAPAHAKGCHDRSHVVGYERCSRFGSWSSEQPLIRLWTDIGVEVHAFSIHPFVFPQSAGGGGLAPRDAMAAADGGLRVTTLAPLLPRLLVGIGGVFYVGVDLSAAAIVRQPAPATGGPALAGHVLGGAHALWNRLSFGGELAAGGRMVGLTAGSGATATGVFENRAELDGRVTADLWLGPHASIGVALATSLVDAHDTSAMIYLGGHVRAFDGMR